MTILELHSDLPGANELICSTKLFVTIATSTAIMNIQHMHNVTNSASFDHIANHSFSSLATQNMRYKMNYT